MWTIPQTPLRALLIICCGAQSRRGCRSVALPPPGLQPYMKHVLPSCWDSEPEPNPVVVFLPLMCPPAATVICACRISPTSHSRALEGSGFPSFDKCVFSLRNVPGSSRQKHLSQMSASPLAEAGPPARPATLLTRPWNYGSSVNGSSGWF